MTNEEKAILEIKHIVLELQHRRTCHFRSFIDQWFCFRNGYVNKSGTANWGKITFNEYVSIDAIGKSHKEIILKEHIIPLKEISKKLLALDQPTLEMVESVLIDNVLISTITKKQDALLRSSGLNHKMPPEYYDPSSDLFNDPFARYKKVGIELFRSKDLVPISQ